MRPKHCPFSPVPMNCEMCELSDICEYEERRGEDGGEDEKVFVIGVFFTGSGFEARHLEFEAVPEEDRKEFWTFVLSLLEVLRNHVENYLKGLEEDGQDEVLR